MNIITLNAHAGENLKVVKFLKKSCSNFHLTANNKLLTRVSSTADWNWFIVKELKLLSLCGLHQLHCNVFENVSIPSPYSCHRLLMVIERRSNGISRASRTQIAHLSRRVSEFNAITVRNQIDQTNQICHEDHPEVISVFLLFPIILFVRKFEIKSQHTQQTYKFTIDVRCCCL